MPYIDSQSRKRIRIGLSPGTPGELNYVITRLIHSYLARLGNPSYEGYNEVVGVLECAKLELFRRWVAPYEDAKLNENGDVT